MTSKPHSELARQVLGNEKKHRMVSITLAREVIDLEEQLQTVECERDDAKKREAQADQDFDFANHRVTKLKEQLEALQLRWDQTMKYLALQIAMAEAGDDTATARLLESVVASLTGDGSFPASEPSDA